MKPVKVKWFVSGRSAGEIVNWYRDRFPRGTRLVAYGMWEEDDRGTFSLKVTKPDEIEILPPETDVSDSSDLFATPLQLSETRAKATGSIAGKDNSSEDEENVSDP